MSEKTPTPDDSLENIEDDEFSIATFGCRPMEYLERTGWATDRTWVAHCVMPNPDEIVRLGAAGVGVAHCPSSNMILASGISPVVDLRARRRLTLVPAADDDLTRLGPAGGQCGLMRGVA